MNELQIIQNKIYEIRGQKVMLDRDLAEMYGVETRALNQAVKRNAERFPEDFMFQMTNQEVEIWKITNCVSNSIKMGIRQKSICIYRTWCSDAIECTQFQNCYSNKYGYYARICHYQANDNRQFATQSLVYS